MAFLRSLTLRGLPTNVGSAAALGFIGDVMCQLGPERRSLPPLSEMRIAYMDFPALSLNTRPLSS